MSMQAVAKELNVPTPSLFCVAELVPATARNRKGYRSLYIEIRLKPGENYKVRKRYSYLSIDEDAARKKMGIPNNNSKQDSKDIFASEALLQSYTEAYDAAIKLVNRLIEEGWALPKKPFMEAQIRPLRQGNVIMLPFRGVTKRSEDFCPA